MKFRPLNDPHSDFGGVDFKLAGHCMPRVGQAKSREHPHSSGAISTAFTWTTLRDDRDARRISWARRWWPPTSVMQPGEAHFVPRSVSLLT